jgi:PAS domain S-box-containing protein
VTERDELRERTAKNEEALRMIFDTATDAIYIKDLKGRYIRVNKACAALFHTQPARMIGRNDYDLFPRELADLLRDEDAQMIKTGRSVATHKEVPTDEGVKFVHTAKTLLKDGNGAAIGVLGVARDITELKKMEAELIRAKALEAVSRVAHPAAHDFNNILAAINGYAVLIMETLKTGNPVKSEMSQIMSAVKRAAAITARLQTCGAGNDKR